MEFEKDYFGFIYKWTNTRNQKYYIGSHFGDISDGYIGSGVWFRRAFDKESLNFVRTILCYCQDNKPEVLLELEQKYLIEIAEVGNKDKCYNISRRAGGGYQLFGKSLDEISDIYQRISESLKNKTEEERESLKVRLLAIRKENPEKFRLAVEKANVTKKNWSPEYKKEIRDKRRATLVKNPEIQILAKQKATETRIKLKLEYDYGAPWRGSWTEERKNLFKEKMKNTQLSKTKEQIELEKYNRAQAQKNRDPILKAQAHDKAVKTLKERNASKTSSDK